MNIEYATIRKGKRFYAGSGDCDAEGESRRMEDMQSGA
jgi:hypothetical protein